MNANPAPAVRRGGEAPPARDGARARTGSRQRDLLREARAGVVEAQYQVGLMFANGVGVARDMTQAMSWIEQAAVRGHVGAQYMLGIHLVPEPSGAALSHDDVARAYDWLQRAAQQGHARAQHRLARLIARQHGALVRSLETAAAAQGVAESQAVLAQDKTGSDALDWLQRAAEQGQPGAQTRLGESLVHGAHGRHDEESGLRWLVRAAESAWPPAVQALLALGETPPALRPPVADPRDAEARFALGALWESGAAGLPVNRAEAAQWYALAAAQGVAAAHHALGRLAEAGADEKQALMHYRAGAEGGDAAAQHALGRLLGDPLRTSAERLEARQWAMRATAAGHPAALLEWAAGLAEQEQPLADEAMRRAAEAGDAQAQARLGDRLLARADAREREQGFAWARRAAAQGHAGALGAVAMAFLGGRGVAVNVEAGLTCLHQAVEQGDERARWNLALVHAGGAHGVPRDLALAMTLCAEAAEAGFVPAQATMGVLCATAGRGDEALRWWRQAAAAGDLEARFNLAQALVNGRGAEPDRHEAFTQMLEAAEAGLTRAQARVGVMYAAGEGVAPDPIEAHKWFFLARMSGDADAARNWARSCELVKAPERAEAERRARAWRDSRRLG